MANATGTESVSVDMAQTHWANGEDVDATIKAYDLDSTKSYSLWYNYEQIEGNNATNGSTDLSDDDGDGLEEYDVTIPSTDLYDDCWNLYADLYDSVDFDSNNGTPLDGANPLAVSSFTFEVGSGVCQGGGPTGPHMWWNGSYWWDTTDSISLTAEIGGLDESLQYTLDWEVTPHDDPSNIMVSDYGMDLTMGAETSHLAEFGPLGDGCYEIHGWLFDADEKEIPGGDAHYLFEVGDGVCQTGPPSMTNVYIHYYDETLEISSCCYEANQSSLNIQVSVIDEAGIPVYSLDMDFTADEWGMFQYEDGSTTFDDGEYMMEVKVVNLIDDSVLFESMDMTLYVYGGGPDAGMSVWTNEMHYPSGSEVFAEYSVWGNEGDNSETVWECRGETYIMESTLQGDHTADNIRLHIDNTPLPEWCDSAVDEAAIVNATGGDMFQGETVWTVDDFDDGSVTSLQYDLDLNITMTVHETGSEEWTVEDLCDEMGGEYDQMSGTCSMIWTLITLDVGDEYIWQEESMGAPWFVCGDGYGEIPFDQVNDGDEDCEDGSDEPQDIDGDGTTDNWFDCHDGSTVSMDVVNDGTSDCPDGEDEGYGDEIEGYHMRYSNDGTAVVFGNIEEVWQPLYDAYVQLYDEDGLVMNVSTDADGSGEKVSLGHLDDGNYGVGGLLRDIETGEDVWSSEYLSNFCVGPDCGGGGPPDMLTGNASLDLTVTFGEYDTANCMGGTVMLFDYDELYNEMMSGPSDQGEEGDGPDPVWMDWQTVTSPGSYTLTELPEGDWVVIVSIGCYDEENDRSYGASNINGPWSLSNTTFVNNSTTTMVVDLQIMDEGGPDDDKDFDTGEIDFTIRIDDSADGDTVLTLTQKVAFSDFMRNDIDCGFGDCNGHVNETESAAAIAMFEMMGPDGRDDGGDDECPFWDTNESPCNNPVCADHESQDCMNAVMAYCQEHSDDPGCEDDGRDDDMGTPEFMWNGVLLTEDDMFGEVEFTISGLVGDVPQDESEDTSSIAMTSVYTYKLIDNGEATQVLSPAPDNEGSDDECPFWDTNESPCNNPVCADHESQDCEDAVMAYCQENSDDPGCYMEDEPERCETIYVDIEDSTTWTVDSITGGDVEFTFDAASATHHAVFNCDDEVDGMAMTFAHVSAEEPEPPVNQPPYCDVYYYAEASDLADFQSTEDKATGSNGTWEVSIVEDDTYWLMFYCMDDEGDSITVNVTSAFGNYDETFAAGSTEGYYELTIPTGSSVLSPYTLAYTWSDGTNSGSGTVTVNVSPAADDGSDGSGEETEGEDASAGSFVPGFTAVLTMTALAGAFLVFSRREED